MLIRKAFKFELMPNGAQTRKMKQEPTEGIALSQREPVGIPVL